MFITCIHIKGFKTLASFTCYLMYHFAMSAAHAEAKGTSDATEVGP